MEPNNKLDLALAYYYKHYHDRKINTYKAHFSDVITTNPKLQDKGLMDEVKLWSEKLYKDGYIDDFKDDDRFYVINFDGMMFHLQDGYTGQLKDLKRKRFRDRLNQGIISFAAVIGILFALWEFCKEICSLLSYPYCS